MKKIIHILIVSAILLNCFILMGQKPLERQISIYNISLNIPENYLVQEDKEEYYGYTIRLNNPKNENHLVINCIYKAMDVQSAIISASSKKSLLRGFEYMIIEKVISKRFNTYNAQFVEYTNSPIRDYFRGGFYGFIDNGYTYVIDYYCADTPEDRKEVEAILKSIKVEKPKAKENFIEIEKQYLKEDVSFEDNFDTISLSKDTLSVDNSAKTNSETDKKVEKKSFWQKITSIFKK
ncbi:MAG: hypothetical protein LBM25_05285 [Bacteroidales bacterium]|jgi:hypothetical protein|nr:hypothetical protein [Bacteroidales bacterium]